MEYGVEGGPKTAANFGSKGGSAAGRAPRPIKRGNSLNPKRMKTSSAAELGGLKGVGSIGTAADSVDFSKKSRMAHIEDEETKQRPGTEFLPTASQDLANQLS